MSYNILIDTSIFVNQCFCFDNKCFQSLSRLRRAGLINLFITDVVKAEVEERINISIRNGAKLIKKDAHILGAHLDINQKTIIDDLLNKFHSYINTNFTILEVPEGSIGKRIISNYLENKPPFDKEKISKKYEFPDAFIIETFAEYLVKHNLRGIFLSNDKDSISFISNNNNIEYENNIGTLLDKLNRENEEYTAKISQVMKTGILNLRAALNTFIADLPLDNYDYTTHEFSRNSFYDFEISSLDYVENSVEYNSTEFEIYDIVPEENYVQLVIPVSYRILSVLNANNYDDAIYDKEDDKYYFVESIEIDNTFEIEEVDISVGLDLNTGDFEVLSETNEIAAVFNIDEPLEEEREEIDENS